MTVSDPPAHGITQRLSRALEADPLLGPLAEQASAYLGRLAMDTFLPTTAEWDVSAGGGERRLKLRLADEMSRLDVEYLPAELMPADRLRYKLIRLWGDKLEGRLLGFRDARQREWQRMYEEAAVGDAN